MTSTALPPCQTHSAAGRRRPAIQSIADTAGRPARAAVTRDQIGAMTLMSCGARDFVKDDANGLLMFRVGPNGQRVCKVLVRLMPDDTYTVEYGLTDLRRSQLHADHWGVWQPIAQETGVYAEDLAPAVRRLGDRDRY